MGSNDLYIVESPQKANKIKSLGYNAISTLGQINEISIVSTEEKDLTKMENFKIIPKREKYDFLEEHIKATSGKIIIGTDNDIIGEGIGWGIKKICDKYNKKYVRNPLMGLSNRLVENFVNLDNARKFYKPFIKQNLSRIVFDKILVTAFEKVLGKELNKKIKLGRVQHSVLLLLNKFKNYYRYSLGDNYYFLSEKEFKLSNIKKKENLKILKISTPFNTAEFFLHALSLSDFNASTTIEFAEILQKLYYKEFISYPRTSGSVLEEDAFNILYYKAKKSGLPVVNYKLTSQYEKALSPLKLVATELNGDLAKAYALILRRAIAYLIKPYLTKSYVFTLETVNGKTYDIELLYDEKKIVSFLYMPEYLIDDPEAVNLFEFGIGLDEYQIIKLLYKLKIGKPSTYGYIIELLLKKEFIERTGLGEILLTGESEDILNVLENHFPFLTLEFYQQISEDFENIAKGVQTWDFPIKKLLKYLKKYNFAVSSIDFNTPIYIDEELEYRKMWVFNTDQNSKFNLKF